MQEVAEKHRTDLLRIGIIGYGVIARRQHLPSIAQNQGFTLVAVADPVLPAFCPELNGALQFKDAESLLAHGGVDAVAVCTPPRQRPDIARLAIAARKHVLLEKPPAATLGDADALRLAATTAKTTLFMAWHSRFNPAVERARALLRGLEIVNVRVTWEEDVEQFHPGQRWMWEPEGFGVFDAGMNAISILTYILKPRLVVRSARLLLGPGEQTPIAAWICAGGSDLRAVSLRFDWEARQTNCSIEIETRDGQLLRLLSAGRIFELNDAIVTDEPKVEYRNIYEHYSRLIRNGRSDVDLEPLRVTQDALSLGRRIAGRPF